MTRWICHFQPDFILAQCLRKCLASVSETGMLSVQALVASCFYSTKHCLLVPYLQVQSQLHLQQIRVSLILNIKITGKLLHSVCVRHVLRWTEHKDSLSKKEDDKKRIIFEEKALRCIQEKEAYNRKSWLLARTNVPEQHRQLFRIVCTTFYIFFPPNRIDIFSST